MMTQLSQTTNDVREIQRGPHGERAAAADERTRLQLLVGELLSENQRLRFENEELHAKAAGAEERAQYAERGLAETTKWAGMVF